jgi:hypothetical protein
LDTLIKFKFDFKNTLENTKEQIDDEPIIMQEEFRAIHSENLVTMKRMISDCHLEVVQPLISIQAVIERN